MSANNSSPISTEVVSNEMTDIDGAEGLMIDKFHMDNKGKAIMEYEQSWNNQTKDAFIQEPENSDEELSDYESDDSSYGEFSLYDQAIELQAQFDALDAPPGQEVEVNFALLDQPSSSQNESANRGLTIPNELYDCIKEENDKSEEILRKYKQFKQFDTVDDFSDHKYKNDISKSNKVSQTWSKTIQNDWKLLKKDLPDTIFVRVYEERMDLLRAVIVGPAGTPYHDGLFFFDAFFPYNYPAVPPKVLYHSCGLRINPNLYNCGKVCLSLLNTWTGDTVEMWTPGQSTMLQVLLSLQALVLNTKPYFNEPGYASSAGSITGEQQSRRYSEEAFILSCKTMLYMLKNPPKHFQDLVVGHFRERAFAILMACKAYIEGAEVCSVIAETQEDLDKDAKNDADKVNKNDAKKDVKKRRKTCFTPFTIAVSTIAASLVPTFLQNGAKNCEQFIPLGDVYRLSVKQEEIEIKHPADQYLMD